MKLSILCFYLVLVLTHLEDGKAKRTWGRSKASNTGTTRSRSVKATGTKSSTLSHVSLPNKSYNRKPQISQPRLDKVQFEPKKVAKGQGRKPLKQKSKITPINKQKVADIKASLRKIFKNEKSSKITKTKKQNGNSKLPALKNKTQKTTQDIRSALKKHFKKNKSDRPKPNLMNKKTTSHSSIASALRSFVTKQKGVNAGSGNKPRKLPRRICKRSVNDCPDLNDDVLTGTLGTHGLRVKFLTDKGIKFNEKNLKGTVEKHKNNVIFLPDKGINLNDIDLKGTVEKHKNDAGDVIFLEKGSTTAGLIHILDDDEKGERKGHREDFKNSFGLQGTKKQIDKQIEAIILKAAGTESLETVTGNRKHIKEVEWKGVTKKINLVIGDNGFIVSSFPASSDKVKHAPKAVADTQIGDNVQPSKTQLKKARKRAANIARKEAKKEAERKKKEEAKNMKPQTNLSAGSA